MKSSLDKEKDKIYKKWKREYRYLKRELIRRAKRFEVWDYSYMNKVVFQMIKLMHSLYTKPEILAFDTSSELCNWEEEMKTLDECLDIVNKLENYCIGAENEYTLITKLYTIISESIFAWWE